MKLALRDNCRTSLLVATSMGVRITPVGSQPVHSGDTFHMQATSAETNVASISSYLGLPVKVLTTFVKGSPIARFIKDNLAGRHMAYEGPALAVEGAGLIDCHLYTQPGRAILHLVNLTSAGTWRQPVHELIRVGPLRVRVKLPEGVRGKYVRLLVAERTLSPTVAKGWAQFEIPSVLDHEVAVVG